MRILLGTLLGYSLRQRERLLITILTIVLITIYIVLPALSLAIQAIALTHLGLSVHRERLARPKQTRVPAIKGLDCQSAVTTLRDSHLNIRVLATRYDLPQQPGTIVDQSPAPGEQVDYNYAVGVTITDTSLAGQVRNDKKSSRDGFTPRTSNGRPSCATNYKRTTINANLLLPFNNPSQLKSPHALLPNDIRQHNQ
jgi:hypothetical protein